MNQNYEYYLYRHVRLDKNEVFYVGIGTKILGTTFKVKYNRSIQKSKRNIIWQRIVRKSDYRVEIIFESNSQDEIKQKEVEFIKLYGRKDLGTGTLCNLTDGGDGVTNRQFSEETLKKMQFSNVLCYEVFVYLINGQYLTKYSSAMEATRKLNLTRCQVNACCNGKQKSCNGYLFFKEYRGNKLENVDIEQKYFKVCLCNKDDQILKIFKTHKEVIDYCFIAHRKIEQLISSNKFFVIQARKNGSRQIIRSDGKIYESQRAAYKELGLSSAKFIQNLNKEINGFTYTYYDQNHPDLKNQLVCLKLKSIIQLNSLPHFQIQE